MKKEKSYAKDPNDEEKLQELAATIKIRHAQHMAATKTAIANALDAGKFLIEAKKLLEYKKWLPWVTNNFKFSVRMAQNYMRVARTYKDVLAAHGQAAEWTLAAFLAVSKDLERKKRGKAPTETMSDYQAICTAITTLDTRLDRVVRYDGGDLAKKVTDRSKRVSLVKRMLGLAKHIVEVGETTAANLG